MTGYKRNQIVAAVSAVLEPGLPEPSSELRTKLKRLLDTDRSMGRNLRSNDPEKESYAFYSDDPPGSGVEIWFSAYEAFALLNGIQLMQHGWPQGFAASVLRRVRVPLETEHARILMLDRKSLFDKDALRRSIRVGSAVFDNTDPVLLTIVSGHGLAHNEQDRPVACSVHRGTDSAMNWILQVTRGIGGGSSMFEQATNAHALAMQLERTHPQRRGRTS
jgi:hypothetical protein